MLSSPPRVGRQHQTVASDPGRHQKSRSSRSLRNTSLDAGSFVIAGNESRSLLMTVLLVSRRNALISRSSANVVTNGWSGS